MFKLIQTIVPIDRRRAEWDILSMLVKRRKLCELALAAGTFVEPPSTIRPVIYVLPALVTLVGYIIKFPLSNSRRAIPRLQMD